MERHDFDPISFVFGLAFVGLGLLFLVGPVAPTTLGWLLPVGAIGLGLAVLGSAWLSRRRALDPVDPYAVPASHDAHPDELKSTLPERKED